MFPTCPPPRSELVLSPASMLSYEDHYVHSPRAASTIHSYVQYCYDAIPPFQLQADYAWTILGIQYNDSTVSFYAISQMPLTILTALVPFYKSADTFDDDSTDTL